MKSSSSRPLAKTVPRRPLLCNFVKSRGGEEAEARRAGGQVGQPLLARPGAHVRPGSRGRPVAAREAQVTHEAGHAGSAVMWRRQCCVGPPQDSRRGSVLLRCVLAAAAAASRQQVAHASHGKRKRLDARRTNYYDVLQLTPKATQAQVKDAYYKLSKMYHPDQYRGDEDPAKKFREIKEAYEVLGNFHQRKMYDRGLLGVSPAATPAEAEEYSSKFYESRRQRGQVPTASGRTPIYNFDEWSKIHYQSARQRRENTKARYEQILRDRVTDTEEKRTQSIISIMTLTGVMFLVYYTVTLNYDTDKKNIKKSNSSDYTVMKNAKKGDDNRTA